MQTAPIVLTLTGVSFFTSSIVLYNYRHDVSECKVDYRINNNFTYSDIKNYDPAFVGVVIGLDSKLDLPEGTSFCHLKTFAKDFLILTEICLANLIGAVTIIEMLEN